MSRTRLTLRLMMLFAAIFALSGCVTTQTPKAVPDSSCVAFSVIRPSRQDTLDTKKQVLEHNTVYRKICGAK